MQRQQAAHESGGRCEAARSSGRRALSLLDDERVAELKGLRYSPSRTCGIDHVFRPRSGPRCSNGESGRLDRPHGSTQPESRNRSLQSGFRFNA
jgi:hypothetical protein